MASDPNAKHRMQTFKNKGKDQDVSTSAMFKFEHRVADHLNASKNSTVASWLIRTDTPKVLLGARRASAAFAASGGARAADGGLGRVKCNSGGCIFVPQ